MFHLHARLADFACYAAPAKLWRMNKRLALLMQESQSWNSQFTQFQGFTEKLSSEATDLRTKLERERREAKRLSGVISESRQAQEQLSKKLSRAEEAHKEAVEELERIDEFRRELQEQRDIMFTEMATLAAAAEDANVLADIEHKIELKAETLSARSASAGVSSPGDRVTSRSSMALLRAPSKASMRSARASSLGPASPTAKEHALNRTRKISTASNGTTRTLTELREEGIEEASEAKDFAEELPEDVEEEDYLEAAAMRRMVRLKVFTFRL